MLYNGENIGDGSPPQVDIAVDPLEGTTLTAGLAQRAGRHRPVRARDDVRSRAVRLHGEDRRRRGDRRPARSSTAADETLRWSPSARASTSATSWSSCSTAPRHEEAIEEIRDAGARMPPHHGRRRVRRAARGRPTRRSTSCGGSAARPRASSRPPRSSAPAARLLGRLWPRDDEERRRRSRPATTSTRSSPPTTSSRATTASSRPRASPTATCSRASATRGERGVDRVARHAVALGHRAPHPASHDRTKLREITGERYG